MVTKFKSSQAVSHIRWLKLNVPRCIIICVTISMTTFPECPVCSVRLLNNETAHASPDLDCGKYLLSMAELSSSCVTNGICYNDT